MASKKPVTTSITFRLNNDLIDDLQTERARREKAGGCKLSLNVVAAALLSERLVQIKGEN